ncbi:MAG: DoxX family protein [Acidobacteria bacterium]|nr:DoxX family protein [Acidobacteriota bacterium]
MRPKLDRFQPYAFTLLRIMAGFLFSLHGVQKLFGLLGARMTPPPFTLLWTAGVLEAIGGALVIAGLFTRPVAFVLSGEMAAAYFRSHAPRGFWPIMNAGELAALYSFVFLYFVFAGAGPWSLDRLLRKRS